MGRSTLRAPSVKKLVCKEAMIHGALKNPHLVVVAALAVLVLGVVSYRKTPADLLPMFDTSAVQIVTF